MSKYVAESITTIAGRFGHEGLCQLRTKLKKLQYETCYIVNTAIIVIDSATYLLMISSPDINKLAMSLYDIIDTALSSGEFEQLMKLTDIQSCADLSGMMQENIMTMMP